MRPILTIASLGLFASCGSAASLSENIRIFDAAVGPSLLDQCSRPAPESAGPFFRPSAGDVQHLEEELSNLFNQEEGNYPRTPGIVEPFAFAETPEKFVRQYVGLHLGNRRIIYGNFAFGNTSLNDSAMTVCDGGAQFFGVEYDIARGHIDRVDFNGSLEGPYYEPIVQR